MKKTAIDTWICSTEGCKSLTRETIEQMQLNKLNALLQKEKIRQGFYKNLPECVDVLAELEQLPFTTPVMLREYVTEMNLVPASRISRMITEQTSGTTGRGKRMFYTEGDQEHTVGFFAAGLSEITKEGEKVIVAMPRSAPGGLSDLIARGLKKLGAMPLQLGIDQSFAQIVWELEKQQPSGYVGMAVPFLGLLRYCRSREIPNPIKRAVLSGDACQDGVLKQIRGEFAVEVFPHFGMRETGLGGAATCQAHSGMHLRENHILAEIIGSDNKPVADGKMGELVITTIGMEALPLIRYRTGDMACIVPGECPCGGVTKRLGTVKRIVSGVSMADLDEALFGKCRHLIDYTVHISENNWKLTVRNDGVSCGRELSEAVLQVYPAAVIDFEERSCIPEDIALYPAKRFVR